MFTKQPGRPGKDSRPSTAERLAIGVVSGVVGGVVRALIEHFLGH